MSSPRYVPREFLVHPLLFGKQEVVEWLTPEVDWGDRRVAQSQASRLQHRMIFRLLRGTRADGKTMKVAAMARHVGIPYERALKLANGTAVMQFEDVGQLRSQFGDIVDLWFLDGPNAAVAKEVMRVRSLARR